MNKPIQRPLMAVVHGVNPMTALLREYAAKRQMSQRQIAEAIYEQTGVRRSQTSISFLLSGKDGDDRPVFGTKPPRQGQIPLVFLVAKVLDVPEAKFRAAWEQMWEFRADIVRAQGGMLVTPEAYIGYFQQMYSTLQVLCSAWASFGANDTQTAHDVA